MTLQFKDEKSKFLFSTNKTKSNIEVVDEILVEEDGDSFSVDYCQEKIVLEVSSNLTSLASLENMREKLSTKEDPLFVKRVKINQENENSCPSSNINNDILMRIDNKQNSILKMFENLSIQHHSENTPVNEISSDINILKLNLELFYSKFVILSTKSDNIYIEELLISLNKISEHILANSFNIFNGETSPVKEAIKYISNIGVGDYKLNTLLGKVEELLLSIDNISTMKVFERNFQYSNILLEKSLVLNSITLLNEASSIYLIESIKKFSSDISEYTTFVGEGNVSKLYSNAKEFFIALFAKDSSEIVPLFPNHKIAKKIEKEIAKKMLNISRTWSNKGDDGLFKRYAYIITRVRYIRNSLAHGNMDINFKNIKKELLELSNDFYYLTIQKNILKK
ncbi:MAG: hypothetical protein U9P38_06580 [Campylobacterota bacterium]|nr:hypothetical protein [Campylobacterota bacterium]